MYILRIVSFIGLMLLYGCSSREVKPVALKQIDTSVSYMRDVKPILEKRCIVCHSCYNSPCQAKFSSYEGIDRGASKIEVYNATRLSAQEPTRLFIDAQTTQEWRKKGFYSVTHNMNATQEGFNDSIMMQLLHEKQLHPEIVDDYDPEHDDLVCPSNHKELGKYLDKRKNGGMPYGFPALSKKEYRTLASWLYMGAKGPSKQEYKKLTTPSDMAQQEIIKWEHFLNQQDPKHQMTARYLYEHLYLAHLYFPAAKGEFFTLIRSKTPSGQPIERIVTLRPFDDPKSQQVYYRFEKIHSTIVHKTHMVFVCDDAKLKRLNELFIKPKWVEQPHLVSYSASVAANPFIAYKQIPTRSRYLFLLDNSRYIVMTFIRGPVCRGQMALNVIHDHFWVMFKDPKL